MNELQCTLEEVCEIPARFKHCFRYIINSIFYRIFDYILSKGHNHILCHL